MGLTGPSNFLLEIRPIQINHVSLAWLNFTKFPMFSMCTSNQLLQRNQLTSQKPKMAATSSQIKLTIDNV